MNIFHHLVNCFLRVVHEETLYQAAKAKHNTPQLLRAQEVRDLYLRDLILSRSRGQVFSLACYIKSMREDLDKAPRIKETGRIFGDFFNLFDCLQRFQTEMPELASKFEELRFDEWLDISVDGEILAQPAQWFLSSLEQDIRATTPVDWRYVEVARSLAGLFTLALPPLLRDLAQAERAARFGSWAGTH